MNDSDQPALVELRELSRRSNTGQSLLRQINLVIRAGDRLGILGVSGSGKTLLLRSLAALDPLEQGTLCFQGATVAGGRIPEYRAQVCYLPQRPVLVEGSVVDNLRQPFTFAVHRGRSFSAERVEGWLRELGRDRSFLDKDKMSLSGGELQIVALLRAMQLGPRVLLLDEPTAALDTIATATVERLVDRWLTQTEGQGAFVWVTHAAEQAQRVAQRILRMSDGQLFV